MIVLGSAHVHCPMKAALWAVRRGPVTCYVRVSDPVNGGAALYGATLCGRTPDKGVPPRFQRLSSPTEKTCNACLAEACREPSRLVWR